MIPGMVAMIDLFRLEQQTPTPSRNAYTGGPVQSLALRNWKPVGTVFAHTREMKNGGRLECLAARHWETGCSCCCDNRNQKR